MKSAEDFQSYESEHLISDAKILLSIITNKKPQTSIWHGLRWECVTKLQDPIAITKKAKSQHPFLIFQGIQFVSEKMKEFYPQFDAYIVLKREVIN